MKKLIALNGFAGAGKNECAKALEGWQVISFADPIRQDLLKLNPLVSSGLRLADALHNYGGWDGAKRSQHVGPEVRRLMQAYGMMGRERFGCDVWVNMALPKILGTSQNCVIVDLRFDNELMLVKRLGGIVVRITRPGVGPVNDHCSECQEIHSDFELVNETIADLHKSIRVIAG